MDANNLKVKDLLILIGIPILLIGGGSYIASVSIKLLYSFAFLFLGLFFLVIGLIAIKRRKTGDGDYIDTYAGGSGSAAELLYYVFILISPLLKGKEGVQAAAVGYFLIILSILLLIGGIWLGLPENLKYLV